MKVRLNKLDYDLYKEELDNGLVVYFVPMENKNNYYISFATRYGSEVSEFIPVGEKEYVSVPIARSIIWKVLSTDDLQVISPYPTVVIVVIIK